MKRLLINRMSGRNIHEEHRAATPLELFYDLVFVVAVGACASSLHHALVEHHYEGIVIYLAIFIPMWWAWMNYTWFSSAFDSDDTYFRLISMVQMAGALIMAAGMKGFFNGDALLGLLGYIVMRVAMISLWLRVAKDDPEYATTARRYAYGLLVMQVLWVIWYLVTQDMGLVARLTSMMFFMAGELLVPLLAERDKNTPWHSHHIAERYGLLTIIVLGEGIIGVSNAIMNAREVDILHALLIGFSGTVLVFALWWLYFKVPFAQALHARSLKRAFMFGYGHYFIFAALAAVGTGLELVADNLTDNPGEHSGSPTMAIITLAVAVAVYMLTLSIIRASVVNEGKHNLAAILAALLLPTLSSAIALTHLLPMWVSVLVIAVAPIVMIWLYSQEEKVLASRHTQAHSA
ncbi:low temperature requirement protein A [Thiofilum flexile]|uniref:low temperature requirement protein A n=1 Tax=Thiofilum flexile TaxID=125627 RepID=UPI0003647828|nr:low temperature requirement protein A [Thiofilum flexile]